MNKIAGPTPMCAAFRFIEPSWHNYIMYVDMEAREGNTEALRYLECWRALTPEERAKHMPEQICELANVKSWDVVGWVSRQMFAEGNAKAAMCMSVNRARVLEKTAEYAMADPANFKHAELFAKTAGMMPAAGSGTSVTVPIFNAPMATATARSESSPQGGLPSMDQQIIELSRVMQSESSERCAAEIMPDEDDDEEEEGPEEED